MISPDVWDVISTLPNQIQSEHFIIHFGDRNPPRGRGLGVNGVRDRVLILTYLKALEGLYRAMTAPPWNWPLPLTDESKKTRVYVCDEDPATNYDENNIPCVLLPSRSDEPTSHGELLRAAAEAVHEATHVFTFTHRPHQETSSKPWIWFDEGLAVLMETMVSAGNPDYFRFLQNWIDMPECSLDDPDERYQAGIFLNYLHQRLGPEFIKQVWTQSDLGEGPIEALERFSALRNLTFLSANPTVQDLFGSGYCVDPFFMWDHRSVAMAPDIFFRFGERAISQSFFLASNTKSEVNEDMLDHLSCRYYRFNLASDVSSVKIDMLVEGPCEETKLKAEVAIVDLERQRERIVALKRAQNSPDGTAGLLSENITVSNGIHHLVLVVSNCGKKARGDGEMHDDGKSFHISAVAQ